MADEGDQEQQADTAIVTSLAVDYETKQMPASASGKGKESKARDFQLQQDASARQVASSSAAARAQTSDLADAASSSAFAGANVHDKLDTAPSGPEMAAQGRARRSARNSVVPDKHNQSTSAQATTENHQIRQERVPEAEALEHHEQPSSSSGLTVPRAFDFTATKKTAERTSPRKAVSSKTAKAGSSKQSLADLDKKEKKVEREFKKATIATNTAKVGRGRPLGSGKAPRPSSTAAIPTAPAGFRVTSSGQLVPQHTASVFSFDADGAAASGRSSMTARQKEMLDAKRAKEVAANNMRTETKARSGYKANGVPEWLKQRKDQLQAEEEERVKKQMELVRQKELADGKGKRKAASANKKAAATGTSGRKATMAKTVAKPFVSSLEARAAERAEWEAKRKANEEAIEAARQEAREEKLRQEEEEYKEARKRAVPKANPVPEWLYGGTVERLPS